VPAGFVGRAEEVRALAGLVARAGEASAPAVALVLGQPGSGKTRLLAEVHALLPEATCVRVGGYEPESSVPLAAVRDLLRLLADGPDGVLVRRLLFTPGAAPVEQFQLFEAAFRAVQARAPLTVVVDDLQWADETSTALLHYLVRAAGSTDCPLTLVMAGRPTPPVLRLRASLAQLLPDPTRLLAVELGPLDRAAGIRLARELAPDLDEAAADLLWERAGGSPFWTEALARAGGGDGPLELRLSAVTGDAAALLHLLSAAARPLARPDVAGIQHWSPERVVPAADELVAAGLVADTDGRLEVAHDLIRERVVERLPAEQRRCLHRDLARWIAERAADDGMLLEALEHGRRAGVPMPDTALRLAESPRRRLLGAAAVELLQQTAAQVGEGGSAALRRATALLATELGDHAAGLAAWTAIARSAPTAALAADAMLLAAECALHLGRATEAERLLEEAAELAADDERTAIEIHARAATVFLWLRHREAEGQEAALRAVRGARRLAGRSPGVRRLPPEQRRAYRRALLAGAEAAILADRPADVLVLTDELASAAGAEDPRARLRALAEGSLALRWLGRNADAEDRLRPAWAEALAEALPQATLEVGVLFARVLCSRGRLAEAADVLAECRRLGARLAEVGPSRAFSPIVAAQLEASRGNWRGAAEALRSAAAAETDPHFRAHARLERALVVARYEPRRQAPDVRNDVEGALADAVASGCRRCGFEVRARAAEALARLGDEAAAEELLAGWAPDPHDGNRLLRWWGAQARAALLTAAGAAGPAVTAWRETVDEADRCGLVLEGLWARIDLGEALSRTDRPAAGDVLREAGEIAEAMGALTEARAAEQLLRGLGVRTWRRGTGAAGPSTLTDREREVAERVAAGENNAEIAAAMFLSRKTVERHVSNVLAKWGLRNRAELAAAWTVGSRPEGVHR
jgi:DNA-binding CsgD family transcriptional regulator